MKDPTTPQIANAKSAPTSGSPCLVPYYQRDEITIYHGDCLKILPHLTECDITFSSPPYNTIAATKPSGLMAEHNRKQNEGYDGYSDDLDEPQYQEWIREVFGHCRQLSKGLVWINHKTRYRDKQGIHPLAIFPWPFYSEVVWDRGGSITLNARKFAPSHEYLYGFGIPHYWDNHMNTKMTVWRIPPEREVKGHPCPFPVVLASRCIAASCPDGGVVLDPFMGSGTTMLAARADKKRGIGIEINERYCEIAAKRLSQGALF